MGGHTDEQFVYLRQQQGRNTHLERKGMVSSLRRRAVSQKQSRATHLEGTGGILNEECRKDVI